MLQHQKIAQQRDDKQRYFKTARKW